MRRHSCVSFVMKHLTAKGDIRHTRSCTQGKSLSVAGCVGKHLLEKKDVKHTKGHTLVLNHSSVSFVRGRITGNKTGKPMK